MFQPTVLLAAGPFYDHTVQLVLSLRQPKTVVHQRSEWRNNVLVAREHVAKILLNMNCPFEYDGPDIQLANGSRWEFRWQLGETPVVLMC